MTDIRAVIDTNIIVSGLLFGGIPLKVLQAGFARKFIWFISPPLIEEMGRVFRSKKFALSQSEVDILVAPVLDTIEIVLPSDRLSVITRCSGDNRVLECSVEGKCSHIVTGDRRDLLSLKKFKDVEIVAPRQFLAIL